ncbi:MAG: hypothetical protein EHM20_14390 [Alphaproteobacteria bacterium]|nr:MAG: hypothetical protein EHM20_14390 [Alphaproteobacteria bacterium]
MSDNIQLELNFQEKTFEQMTFDSMQKQLDAMQESMHKVRKKLFGEVGEIKKICSALLSENEILRYKLNNLCQEKTEWFYKTEDSLFEERKMI